MFGLTEDQVAYGSWVRRTALEHLGSPPGAPSTEHSGSVNRPLVRRLGDLGLLRGLFGSGPDGSPHDAAAVQLCLLRENLARVDTEAETALALQGLGSYPILQAGGPEAVERWLPGVVSGEVVPAFALSEPDAGSDAAALSLRAEPDGDGWRLHGVKTWISNAPEADVYAVFARTTPDVRAKGVTAFVVAGDAPGLGGEHLDLLAPHAIGTLVLDGVRVGPGDVLGEVDGGFAVAMRTLDLFRPSVGAFAVGMAQAALDETVAFSTTRHVHGEPLHRQQAVSHALAEMATQVEAARLLVHAAAAAYDRGAPGPRGHEAGGHGQAVRHRGGAEGGGPGGAAARRPGAAAGPPARASLS